MQNTEKAERVLTVLAQRWSGAKTLEYRSTATLTHLGEPRVVAQIHARLRRPNQARIVVETNNPEISCLRVCDGNRIYQRTRTTPIRPAQTSIQSFRDTIMAGVAHPLDEAGYSLDQFLARRPFWPHGDVKLEVARVRRQDKEHYELTLVQGTSKDTLVLDASNYAPLSLVRVGDHGGEIQELLREEFHELILGGPLSSTLFRWTPEDEARR